MAVTGSEFRPASGLPAVALTGIDIRRLNALYGELPFVRAAMAGCK